MSLFSGQPTNQPTGSCDLDEVSPDEDDANALKLILDVLVCFHLFYSFPIVT